MNGTNAQTGKQLTGLAHLKQSIADILATPIGTRVLRRDYGSKLFDLIDKPLNAATRLDIAAATATALNLWEPRFMLEKVNIIALNEKVHLNLYGQYKNKITMIEVGL